MGVKSHRVYNEAMPNQTGFICMPGIFDEYPDTTYTMGSKTYRCTSDSEPGGFADNGLIYPFSEVNYREVTDGTSNTMMVGEVAWLDVGPTRTWIVGSSVGTGSELQAGIDLGFVYNSVNIAHPMHVAYREDGNADAFPNNDTSLGSEHPGGANVCFADGSVHFLSEDVELKTVYFALASRQSGEVIPDY